MQGQTGRELQWSQSLLFTPKTADGKQAVPDYMSPKPARSPSTGYRTGTRERSMSPGSFRRRSLTPSGSFRETPPPPPAESLLESPAGALASFPPYEMGRADGGAAGPSSAGTPSRFHPSGAAAAAAATAASPLAALQDVAVQDGWVTVFGFVPQQLELVLQEFQKCGDVLQFGTFGQGPAVNWVHIQFQNKYAAQRALQRSGMQLSGSLMVGVKPLDANSRMAIEQYLCTTDGEVAGGAMPAPMRPKLTQVRPYSLTKQVIPMPMPARTTWSKINEFVFGL